MKSRLSALIDGEIEAHDIESALRALSSRELRGTWASFDLVGAALRGEEKLSFDISARVMAALDGEPTVFAPRPAAVPPPSVWSRSAMAAAAVAAGVVVVAWVGLGTSLSEPRGTDAASSSAPLVAPPPVAVAPLPAHLQDYLVAHQAHASSGALAGGSRRVVAVSLMREGR